MRSPASGPEGGAVDSEKQRIVNRETDPLGLNNCIISIGNAHRTDSSELSAWVVEKKLEPWPDSLPEGL